MARFESPRARVRVGFSQVFLAATLAACGAGPDSIHGSVLNRAALATENAGGHREGTFEGYDGTRLYEQSWRPAGRVRGTLVVIHGLKDHSARYADFAQKLVDRGYAVYAMDLRGHGRSGGDRAFVNYFEEYLADLDIFVSRVRQREPEGPVFVFGHSMGGLIVTRWTMDYHPFINGIILSGPALKVSADVPGALVGITRSLGRILPHAHVFDLPNENFCRDRAVVEAMSHDPLVTQGEHPARTAAQLLINIERFQEHMQDVTVPLLALHGTQDKLTNPEGSSEIAARASSGDRTVHLYPGLYHDLLHEPEHEQVEADIFAWLDARTR